jgi:hypothetical protein
MKTLKTLILSGILIFFIGCDKNKDNTFLTGNIVGFVKLIDEVGNEVEDKSGVTVSFEELPHSATSNEIGRFELTNVPAGTYNLIFNKPGYSSNKIFSYQFIGGNIPANPRTRTLYELPRIEIKSLDISFNNNTIDISGSITETSKYLFRTYINDSSNVSELNYDYKSNKQSYCCSPATSISQRINLEDTPYSLGDKVYLVIFFYNPEQYGYYDYEEQRYVSSGKKAYGIIDLVLE